MTLLLASLLLLAPQDDAINERLTVPREEYERQWKIDCAEARVAVCAAARRDAIDEARSWRPVLVRCALLDEALRDEPLHESLLRQLDTWLSTQVPMSSPETDCVLDPDQG